MSRIGRAPIAVPAGVTVTIADGNVVTVGNCNSYACGNRNRLSSYS